MAAFDAAAPPGLVHRALLHAGEDDLVARIADYARDGLAAGEDTVVLAPARRLAALRRALGEAAPVGLVPNDLTGMRLGTAFDDVRRHMAGRAGRVRLRVAADWDLGDRSDAQRRAFMRWEAAATAILADHAATVLCCHDGADLELAAAARATHPEVWTDGAWRADDAYRAPDVHLRECRSPPPPGGTPMPLADPWDLSPLRERVAALGEEAGVDPGSLADFQIATNEVAANALWHAHGPREARVALLDGALVFEVRDAGPGLDPLVAHQPPGAGRASGRGLWIAHQLADVVQVVPEGPGTRVRLEIAVARPGAASDVPGGAAGLGGEGDPGGGA
jgi:anti-sigma regulatory factor (Ser/Thr protein kinase)